MKALTMSRDTLLRPLQAVAGVVERRNTLPILDCVGVHLEGGRLSLVATDLQLQISQGVFLEDVSSQFAVTVPARKLLEIVRALPEGELSLAVQGERLALRSASGRVSLQTQAFDALPRVTPVLAQTSLVLAQGAFRALLAQVYFAMGQQDVRYFMNGVQLLIEGDELCVVALDGCRLARATLATGVQLARHDCILPRKTVLELMRLLESGDAPLSIELARDQARFVFGDTELLSKLIDARFPDTQRAIPNAPTQRLTIARAPWLKAMQRAVLLAPEKFRSVRLLIEAGQMTMQAQNAAHDEAEEYLAVAYQGSPLEISFNAVYLLDVLSHLDSESVELGLDAGSLSALLTIPGNSRYQYVAMALRN
jgi:DNA polymerase-3 subunit beta